MAHTYQCQPLPSSPVEGSSAFVPAGNLHGQQDRLGASPDRRSSGSTRPGVQGRGHVSVPCGSDVGDGQREGPETVGPARHPDDGQDAVDHPPQRQLHRATGRRRPSPGADGTRPAKRARAGHAGSRDSAIDPDAGSGASRHHRSALRAAPAVERDGQDGDGEGEASMGTDDGMAMERLIQAEREATDAQEMSNDMLLSAVDAMYALWMPPGPGDRTSFTEWANERMGIGIDQQVAPEELHRIAMALLGDINNVAEACRLRGLTDTRTDAGVEVRRRLAISHHRAISCYYAVESERHCRPDPSAETYDPAQGRVVCVPPAGRGSLLRSLSANGSLIDPAVGWASPADMAFRYRTMLAVNAVGEAGPELNERQQIITYLLTHISKLGLRRHGRSCYKQIIVRYDPAGDDDGGGGDGGDGNGDDDDGGASDATQGSVPEDGSERPPETGQQALFATRAWEEYMTIEDFVTKAITKEQNYTQWHNLTRSHATRAGIIDHLVHHHEAEFPDLEFDRHVWSFPTGVYHAGEKRFYRRGMADMAELSPGIAAAHFIDAPFPGADVVARTHARWSALPLAAFDKLFGDQGITGEALGWVYALLGRCFYWLREHDNWQVISFFKGIANTGKSTLGRMLLSVYPASQTADISCNVQDTFGLFEAHDRFLWACLELKNNHRVQQSDMQSMISGEQLVVNGKNRDARTVEWRVPGSLFGNDPGPWRDAMGSMVRRLVPVLFMTPVVALDGRFEDKLRRELPGFILKCNAAYRQHVELHGDRDIWQVLPDYFHDARRQLNAELDPVTAFLTDPDEWELAPHRYTRYKEFHKRLTRWMRDHVPPQIRAADTNSRATIELVLSRFHCRVATDERPWCGMVQHGAYIVGLGSLDPAAGDVAVDAFGPGLACADPDARPNGAALGQSRLPST